MNLKVPFNTKAKVVLSLTELQSLKINGETWEQFQKNNKTVIINNSILNLGSGEYQIEFIKNKI